MTEMIQVAVFWADAMQWCGQKPMFQRILLPPFCNST